MNGNNELEDFSVAKRTGLNSKSLQRYPSFLRARQLKSLGCTTVERARYSFVHLQRAEESEDRATLLK